MWCIRRQGTILTLAFGCWCFTLVRAQPSMDGSPAHCDELCEFSPWAMHAYCGERALSEIPLICSQVKTLDVRLNNIWTLTYGTLSGFGNLKYLYLDDSEMTVVEAGAFEECDGLELLSWGGNRIQILTKGMLRGLPNLKFMLTSGSEIDEIEPETFGETPLLQTLDLSGNKLATPLCYAFTNDNVLTDLYLSDNLISDLPPECLANLTHLERLKLSNNPIQDVVNISAFRGLNSLRKMELDNTSLRAIPVGAFSYIHTTRYMYLQNNFITVVQERSFATLPNVEYLNLHRNHIILIHPGGFLGMNNLKTLILSNNRIFSFGLHALLPVEPTLQEVHLHYNRLSSLRNLSSSTILSLRKLFIAWNPLQCHCHLHEFRLWLEANPDVLAHVDGNATCLTSDEKEIAIVNSSSTGARCQLVNPSMKEFPTELPSGNMQVESSVNHDFVRQRQHIQKTDDEESTESSIHNGPLGPSLSPLLFTLIALIIFTSVMAIALVSMYFGKFRMKSGWEKDSKRPDEDLPEISRMI